MCSICPRHSFHLISYILYLVSGWLVPVSLSINFQPFLLVFLLFSSIYFLHSFYVRFKSLFICFAVFICSCTALMFSRHAFISLPINFALPSYNLLLLLHPTCNEVTESVIPIVAFAPLRYFPVTPWQRHLSTGDRTKWSCREWITLHPRHGNTAAGVLHAVAPPQNRCYKSRRVGCLAVVHSRVAKGRSLTHRAFTQVSSEWFFKFLSPHSGYRFVSCEPLSPFTRSSD